MIRLAVVRDIRLGINNLLLHRTRSLLTMLGLVFGVASVIAMLAVGNGAGQDALRQIRQLGSELILLESSKPVAEDRQKQGPNYLSVYGLTYLDAERVRETIPAVAQLVPVKIRREQINHRAQAVEVRLVGTTAQWFELVRRELVAGRVLSDWDEAKRLPVAVVTEQVARELFPLQEVVGNFVRAGGNYYQVVGVVRSSELRSGEIASPDRDLDIYIPLATMREGLGDLMIKHQGGTSVRERVELHQLLVKMASEQVVEGTATALESLLNRFHTKDDVAIHVPLTLLRQAEQTQRRFNIVLGAIAGISLLVGGIGIMNIMLASVMERTREIGIRRAIGARRQQIVTQFLIETVVLSCSGGLLGIALGLFLPWVITATTGLSTVVTSGSLVLSLLISLSVGVIFGLYPAIRASRLDPIVALRHE